ncbi:unnamed protein product [Meganyctiphanes norvegica]|uniref:Major facilitator superfamily (MFS) profile domain-containing protein n=1 Tax=Meganyctiphanes norvegica TaxID=48144 RepID=A0AAV2QRB1_MEGNR
MVAESQVVDFDDVLPLAGEFGRYQWVLFLSLAPFCCNLAFIYFTQIFMTLTPERFWCSDPDLSELPHDIRQNLSSLLYPNKGDACQVYQFNYTNWNNYKEPDGAWPKRECTNWEYDLSDIGNYPSIVTELNWVCGRDWYSTLYQSIFFVGAIVGGLIVAWAADRWGRLPMLVACNLIGALSCILTAVASSLPELLFHRFLGGLAFDNIFVMIYVLVLEYVGPSHRTLVANLSIAIFYTLGTVVIPWIALGLGDWRLLSAVISLPMLLGGLAFWLLPESARWLLTQGRVEETIIILKRIAHVNGKTIPEKMLKDLQESTEADVSESMEEESQSVTMFDLLKSPRLRRTTIAISLLWMLVNLVYDGHARNVSNLGSSVFETFSIASATELPADLFLVFTLDRWGRKWMSFGSLMASGIFTIVAAAVSSDLLTIFAVIGRFCVNIAFNIGLQYAAELLPTVVRAQGVASIHIAGYVAGILSPLIVLLGQWSKVASLLVLGVASMLAGLISIMLPETLNRDLPQTLEDGENFGADQGLCYFPCRDTVSTSTKRHLSLEPQPSFIRRGPRHRASVRGETYRSTLIRHRREVMYIPAYD